MPFTTRPPSTSRQGIIRRASVIGRSSSHSLHEIAQQTRARFARFFRMKLHAHQIALFDHRSERKSVIACRDGIACRKRAQQRNAQNKNRRLRNAVARACSAAAAPIDSSRCEAISRSSEARGSLREENRGPLPGASSLDAKSACKPRQIPRIGVPRLISRSQRRREVSREVPRRTPRNGPRPAERLLSRRKVARRAVAFRLRAQLKRAFDGRQIPGSVINNRDFHNNPFVDGNTRRICRSRVTAKRSAFANALNIAST